MMTFSIHFFMLLKSTCAKIIGVTSVTYLHIVFKLKSSIAHYVARGISFIMELYGIEICETLECRQFFYKA